MTRWLEGWACGAAFGLGFMIGPFLGGLLSDPATGIGGPFDTQFWSDYPYLLPCLFSSAMSAIALMLAAFMLPESLPKNRGPGRRSPRFRNWGPPSQASLQYCAYQTYPH